MCNRLLLCLLLVTMLVAAGCGGAGSNTVAANNNAVASVTAANVVPVVVNAGPASSPQTNLLYVTVTVCVPGTNDCQAINNIQVDTGSVGLRILASALSLALTPETDSSGATFAECGHFLGGYTWGPMLLADVRMGGEQAGKVPIQLIGGAGPAAPSACANTGVARDTVDALGANGILGIGPFRQDCGAACAGANASNPGFYYVCTAAACQASPVALEQQAQNPVAMFPVDNNGTILQLPSIPAGGAGAVNGVLIFGIGTQANNALGSATVLTLDSAGNFTTIFAGKAYGQSFVDSGSNGLFFLDSTTTGIPECTTQSLGFYCPKSQQVLTATVRGANAVSVAIPYTVANTNSLSAGFNAFNNLAGPNPNSFDWGLPFFYGRSVVTAIEGQSTPAGTGPLVAF